jgi:hypothetical protein
MAAILRQKRASLPRTAAILRLKRAPLPGMVACLSLEGGALSRRVALLPLVRASLWLVRLLCLHIRARSPSTVAPTDFFLGPFDDRAAPMGEVASRGPFKQAARPNTGEALRSWASLAPPKGRFLP